MSGIFTGYSRRRSAEVGMYERAGDAERIVSKMGLGNSLPSRARAILTRHVHDMGWSSARPRGCWQGAARRHT